MGFNTQQSSGGGGGTIGGSGTLNFISKFTPDGTTIGNSQGFDNGTNLGYNKISSFGGKYHFAGTSDTTQFVVQANATQAVNNPLFKLLKSDGTDLLWLNSDFATNTFVGNGAGQANNAGGGGIDNTFTGYNAGAANSTGTLNTFNGKRAGEANTTGQANNAFGAGALLLNQAGSDNFAFGQHALMRNVANNNGAVGNFALLNCTTGASNLAYGKSALEGLSTGNANNAFGLQALVQNNGSENCAFGLQALYANTSGNNSSAFGSSAGYSNTGSGGVFLGYNAGYYETGSAKLFIDNVARASEADGRLKALIYGVFNASTASQSLRFNAQVINMSYLPTSAAGLATGDLWSNLGILTIA